MNNEYDIAKAFQRIEETLIKSLKRNLTRHLNEEKDLDMNWSAWQTEQLKSLEQFKKNNKKLFKKDFSTINNDIKELIKKSYENGKLDQEKVILKAIQEGNFNSNDKQVNKLWNIYKTTKNKRIKKKQLSRIYEKTNQTESDFFKINDRKLKSLINETTENFKKAEMSILRYSNDQYRKIIFDSQVYANTGSGTVKQAVDMATKDFLSKGINSIEYANGAMVNIAAYAEMAIRTANKRAYLQGEGTKRAEWGVHTVLVPNRGGGCPYCIKFQGKIFIDDVWSGGTKEESKTTGYPLLSTAVKAKLFHPNCKDTTVTYFEGVTTEITTPTEEELVEKTKNYIKEQKINYIDRNINKYKRLEQGCLDIENIEKYHNKRVAWQNYKRQFKKNSKLKFNDIMTNTENDAIIDITFENLLKKLDIEEYDPFENNIQEKASELLGMDKLPKIIKDKQEYLTYSGNEIIRVVHAYHGRTAKEAYENTVRGKIQYSENTNSSFGRGIYFGDKTVENSILASYSGKTGDVEIINAKIDKEAKIIEFKNQIEYIKDVSDRLSKVPNELKKVYQKETSLLYMLDGIDGIKINTNQYYCIYNRGVLVINGE